MNSTVKEILESTRYCTISTVDIHGQPWAAPVWYVYDDELNIYWWSPIKSKHSVNISINPNIYITIFNSNAPEGKGVGVYMRASAEELSEQETDAVIKLYNSTTQIFKMSLDNCTGLAPTRLFKATASKIWINDGIERKGFYEDTRVAVE